MVEQHGLRELVLLLFFLELIFVAATFYLFPVLRLLLFICLHMVKQDIYIWSNYGATVSIGTISGNWPSNEPAYMNTFIKTKKEIFLFTKAHIYKYIGSDTTIANNFGNYNNWQLISTTSLEYPYVSTVYGNYSILSVSDYSSTYIFGSSTDFILKRVRNVKQLNVPTLNRLKKILL